MISPGSLIYFESAVLAWASPDHSTKSVKNFWADSKVKDDRVAERNARKIYMPPLEMFMVIEYLNPTTDHLWRSYIKGLHPSHGIVFLRTTYTVVLYKSEEL